MARFLSVILAVMLLGCSSLTTCITHVVVIIQENRTFNNLFYGLTNATTSSTCQTPAGTKPVSEYSITGDDQNHSHASFLIAYNGGANNGWVKAQCGYVNPSQVGPYWALADKYTTADEFFQGNEGPSGPAHQYLIRGASTTSDTDSGYCYPTVTSSCIYAPDNNVNSLGTGWAACNSSNSSPMALLPGYYGGVENFTGKGEYAGAAYSGCFTASSVISEAMGAGVTWGFYQSTAGSGKLWESPYATTPVFCPGGTFPATCATPGPAYTSSVVNKQYVCTSAPCGSASIFTDIAGSTLPQIAFITPSAACSDHPGTNTGCGPAWVAEIVNAIGQSSYWNNTAIFITWDDWGGLYDPVATIPGGSTPIQVTPNEWGFRVPALVVSPYALTGTSGSPSVDHTFNSFGSILSFIEDDFGLASLNTTDASFPGALTEAFNFTQTPTPFVPISVGPQSAWFGYCYKPIPDPAPVKDCATESIRKYLIEIAATDHRPIDDDGYDGL